MDFKEICRKRLPLKALDQSHTNPFLFLRCKYNFVALKSMRLWEDLKVFTILQILREFYYHVVVMTAEAKSCNCSHIWITCLALIPLISTKPWEQLMKPSLLEKVSDQCLPRSFLCVVSSGASKWWAQPAALPSAQDWHHHSSLCRCVFSGTFDQLGSKRLRGSKDTGEQTIEVECKPYFLGEQAKKIK